HPRKRRARSQHLAADGPYHRGWPGRHHFADALRCARVLGRGQCRAAAPAAVRTAAGGGAAAALRGPDRGGRPGVGLSAPRRRRSEPARPLCRAGAGRARRARPGARTGGCAMKRWLPFPYLSAALLVCWLLLAQSLANADLLLGLLLAFAIPLLMRSLLPLPRARVWRPWLLFRLLSASMVEIVRSCFNVSRIILF